MVRERIRQWASKRALAMLLIGMMAGTLLVTTPVGAHVVTGGGAAVNHVFQHIKPRGDNRWLRIVSARNRYAQRLAAVVDSDGSLVRGARVVSSEEVVTGIYDVTFVRNVRECTYVASVGSIDTTGVVGGTANPQQGPAFDEVRVATWDPGDGPPGSPDSHAFHLVVIC